MANGSGENTFGLKDAFILLLMASVVLLAFLFAAFQALLFFEALLLIAFHFGWHPPAPHPATTGEAGNLQSLAASTANGSGENDFGLKDAFILLLMASVVLLAFLFAAFQALLFFEAQLLIAFYFGWHPPAPHPATTGEAGNLNLGSGASTNSDQSNSSGSLGSLPSLVPYSDMNGALSGAPSSPSGSRSSSGSTPGSLPGLIPYFHVNGALNGGEEEEEEGEGEGQGEGEEEEEEEAPLVPYFNMNGALGGATGSLGSQLTAAGTAGDSSDTSGGSQLTAGGTAQLTAAEPLSSQQEQEPLSAQQEEPLSSQQQEPLSSQQEQEPLSSQQEEPFSSQQEEPLCSQQEQEPLSSQQEEPLSSQQQEPRAIHLILAALYDVTFLNG